MHESFSPPSSFNISNIYQTQTPSHRWYGLSNARPARVRTWSGLEPDYQRKGQTGRVEA